MPRHNHDIIIIGLTGSSCAGKTTFAYALQQQLGEAECAIVFQDWYYFDQSKRFDKDGGTVNFDHPSSIEFELLYQHLLQLLKGEPVAAPMYDFVKHARLATTRLIEPKRVVVVDGILILSQPLIVELLDYIVFMDIAEEICLERRLNRDIVERGRKREGILMQFERQVHPMYQKFVEPHKLLATHTIIDDNSFATVLASIFDIVSKKNF